MTEIELKAHISDPQKTMALLRSLPTARFIRETIKRDVYWHQDTGLVRVRVREENGETTLTYKRKEIQGNIEVNDEQEFIVSNRAALESFLGDSGFTVDLSKEKKTTVYTVASVDGTSITAEFSLVSSLGWFLELEILIDETNPKKAIISRSKEALYQLMAKCGIDESAVEPRYYSELLREIQ